MDERKMKKILEFNASDEEIKRAMAEIMDALTDEQKETLAKEFSGKTPKVKVTTTEFNVQAQRIQQYMILHNGELSNWSDFLRFHNLKTKSLDKYKEAMGDLWKSKHVYKKNKTFYLTEPQKIFMNEGIKELIKEVKPSNNPNEQQNNRERLTEKYLNTEDKSVFYDSFLNMISHFIKLAIENRGRRRKEDVKKDILSILENS